MHITTKVILFSILFCFPGHLFAEEIQFNLINTGIYSGIDTEVLPDSSLPGNEWYKFESAKLNSATTVIRAKLGLNFGFLFTVQASNKDEAIPVTVKYDFPGLKDPSKNDPLHHASLTREMKAGEVQKALYGFDADWELVEGDWTISVYHVDRLLHKQIFSVVTSPNN